MFFLNFKFELSLSALEICLLMRYINLRLLTYLLTYLHTYLLT